MKSRAGKRGCITERLRTAICTSGTRLVGSGDRVNEDIPALLVLVDSRGSSKSAYEGELGNVGRARSREGL